MAEPPVDLLRYFTRDEACAALDRACARGDLPAVQALVTRYKIKEQDVLPRSTPRITQKSAGCAPYTAGASGHLHVMRWLVKHLTVSADAMARCARGCAARRRGRGAATLGSSARRGGGEAAPYSGPHGLQIRRACGKTHPRDTAADRR